ncbi:MAG TPA: hypothetical protein VMT15_16205 [Bryobacteraceae bacterium]|nr:hypothetical protein [Bryobacteraceae bacterium]
MLTAVTFLAQALPRLEDYPVAPVFKGKPAPPKLTTSGQRDFGAVIRTWAYKGPNFAGHYTIAQWGCGAGCMQMAVIDAQTGKVYEAPFGSLPKATICLEGDASDPGIAFRRDSSLLVLKGCPDFKDCGAYYFNWTDAKFKLLRKDLLAQTPNCQP